MGFTVTAKKDGGDFKREILPAGNYYATLYSIVDLGTQIGEWQGKETRQRKIRMSWELPDELRVFKEENGEQPLALHREFTLSFADSAHLGQMISAWRGKPIVEGESIDLDSFLGKNCLLTVGVKTSKEGREYNIINSVAPLMKGMPEKPLINAKVLYTIDQAQNETFNSLPEFIQEKIMKSIEAEDFLPI